MPELALKRIWRVLLMNSCEILKKLGCFFNLNQELTILSPNVNLSDRAISRLRDILSRLLSVFPLLVLRVGMSSC